jgi:hypothetical protein
MTRLFKGKSFDLLQKKSAEDQDSSSAQTLIKKDPKELIIATQNARPPSPWIVEKSTKYEGAHFFCSVVFQKIVFCPTTMTLLLSCVCRSFIFLIWLLSTISFFHRTLLFRQHADKRKLLDFTVVGR